MRAGTEPAGAAIAAILEKTMNPPRRASWLFLSSFALALAPSGCGLLLGLDDFKDSPEGAGSGGSAATGGSSGSGGQSGCKPGTKEPCYQGPQGTEGKGICKAGEHTCNADGMT